MELRSYLAILRRRTWVVLITATVTLLVTLIGTLLVVPEYSASTTLRIATAASGSPDYVNYDITYADRLMNTYTKIATSGPVLAELAQKLGLEKPPQVEVEIPANTELLKITVDDRNPTLAKDAANTLADILSAHVRDQYKGEGATAQDILKEQLTQAEDDLNQARKNYESVLAQASPDSAQGVAAKRTLDLREETYSRLLDQYDGTRLTEAMRANTISVIEPAVVPLAPSKPRKALNLGLGLVVGLVAGVGLAFLFENMDTTLHTSDQIERATELPILGNIPTVKRPRQGLLFKANPVFEDAFLRLRTNLLTLDGDTPLRTLMVTSAEPGEGKSTIVANLAFALAQSGRKVIVVDADFRLPTLQKIFDVPNQFGLSSILQRKISADEGLRNSGIPGLQVLTSGPFSPDPAELLGLPWMQKLVERLLQLSDVVLLDTPALLPVTDAAILAPLVDGVILVLGRDRTRREAIQAACQQLASIRARALGVVVNRVDPHGIGIYSYYHQAAAQATQSFHYHANGTSVGAEAEDLPPEPTTGRND